MSLTISVGITVLSSLLGAFGSLFLKKGSERFALTPTGILSPHLIIGGLCYVSSIVIFGFALRGSELSFLYPILSLGFIWTTLLSRFMLHEHINRYKWIGVVLIILGVTFIGIGS